MLERTNTRDQILATAHILFAARGFYGASLNDIAKELGVTKQAVLHHFGSKEKLYAAVLSEISAAMMEMTRAARSRHQDPAEQLHAIMREIYQHTLQYAEATKILMRELLDVEQRAEDVSTWYLKPFLKELTDTIRALPGGDQLTPVEALAKVYPLLGVINYLVVSETVLTQIYGKRNISKIQQSSQAEFREHTETVITSLN